VWREAGQRGASTALPPINHEPTPDGPTQNRFPPLVVLSGHRTASGGNDAPLGSAADRLRLRVEGNLHNTPTLVAGGLLMERYWHCAVIAMSVEFMCAGTLALLAQKGYEIHIATMTVARWLAAADQPADPRAPARGSQSRRGRPERPLPLRRQAAISRSSTSSASRRAGKWPPGSCARSPQIVFTHPPVDYLPDHEQTYAACPQRPRISLPFPLYDCGVPTPTSPGSPICITGTR